MSDPHDRPDFDQPYSHPGTAAKAEPAEPAERAEPAEPVELADSPDERVAAAVGRLDELAAKDPADHVEIYEQVHRELHDALTDAADERAGTDAADQRTATDQDADPGGSPP